MARLGSILTVIASFLLLIFAVPTSSLGEAATGEEKTKQPVFEIPSTPRSALTASQQRGANLFGYYCTVCHGNKGEGDGFNSFQLPVPPAKLADAEFMSKLSNEDIAKVIKGGGPALGRSPQMPTWGRLFNDREVADLVSFIRTLSRK